MFTVLLLASVAAGEPLRERSIDKCEYWNVFVNPAATYRDENTWDAAELMRQRFLEMAVEKLPDLGLRVVPEREKARWAIGTSVLIGPTGNFIISVSIRKELELTHAIYLALLGHDDIPLNGSVRGEYDWVIRPQQNPETFRRRIDKGVTWIWGRNSELVSVLCDSHSSLREEGWDGLGELRLELVEEMKRVRGERARQKKHLHLEAEEAE
jgi:hypothetical protein